VTENGSPSILRVWLIEYGLTSH